ncbi:kinase/pyrophosphorylase [Bacillus sp. H-16]|uniref:pyruvate, water dikinase regulatory protein n=1 Tax=Alteribacter salitolerans TaxID=2912333 RepID=UPI001966C059|nr:pyruvate, water dikinase regulatory protein [Alteribacter salitolerans]MBM7097094.1 kinase/pyrophosphorylase [Alteribacter salitolerans]
MSKRPVVYVLSDSVGETAELVVKASASQFNHTGIDVRRVPYVEDEGTIDEVIAQAKEDNGIIAFTLVVPELRDYLIQKSSHAGVPIHDIITPMMDLLEKRTGEKPRLQPGLIHTLDEDYFRKVEAIEFAVKYDDGRDPRGVKRADIVLVGVSRTSKTPLSQYLAHKRLKVANIPLVPEVDPPEELFHLDKKKVIGLKISPEKLNSIRSERLKSLGLKEEANYATLNRIEEELRFSDKVMERIGCQYIDVSNKAVEETANIIYNIYRKNNN